MTVKELIEELKQHPETSQVVMSSDGEGNSYSPLAATDTVVYVPGSTYSGDIYPARTLTPELQKQGLTDEDCYDEEDAQDAVAFWPTN